MNSAGLLGIFPLAGTQGGIIKGGITKGNAPGAGDAVLAVGALGVLAAGRVKGIGAGTLHGGSGGRVIGCDGAAGV